MTSAQALKEWITRHKASLGLLLVMNGLLGAMAGLLTSTWQVSIETSQVFAGLVTYDPHSFAYIYYAGTFALVNYIGVWLLYLTHSEIMTSAILCALVGSIMQQSVAMIIFLGLRNAYAATLGAALLIASHWMAPGIAYPITLLGTEHIYGRIGMFFTAYALLFLAFNYYRTGFLLSGLALWVHPLWGVWLNGALGFIMLLQNRRLRPLFQIKYLVYLAIGVAVSVTAFFWQKLHYPIYLPDLSADDAQKARDIFLAYIRNWDYHRQKFDNGRILFTNLAWAAISPSLAAIWLRTRKIQSIGEQAFFFWIIASALFSAVLLFIPSWFDPAYFPGVFVEAMPARFINFVIFTGPPLLVGYVLFGLSDSWAVPQKRMYAFWCGAIVLLSLAIAALYGFKKAGFCFGVMLGIGILVLTFSKRITIKTDITKWINILLPLACAVLLTVSSLHMVKMLPKHMRSFEPIPIPAEIHGPVLTTMDYYLLQIQSRVSILTPHIDGYVWIGSKAMIPINQFESDIFGISLIDPPRPNLMLHQSLFITPDFTEIWQKRTCDQWEKLSEKYQFDMVMVPSNIHLQLPKADNDPLRNKYYPSCE